MNQNLQIPPFKYEGNNIPVSTTTTLSDKQTSEAINLKDRYELLLNKLDNEIQQQKLNKHQKYYNYIENSEENPSQVFYSASSQTNSNSSNQKIQNSEKTNRKKKESIDDYIQNLLFELNQWNETWEKCILMATKVIKYHSISAKNTDQQRAILIDIVQQLCGTIIAETKCHNNNVDYNKYRKLVEKRKKDKKRLRKMQKRCDDLFNEVQKNREMLEIVSKSKKKQSADDIFLKKLLIEHNKNNNDQKKNEEEISKQIKFQVQNDEKFRNEIETLHKKRRERKNSNQKSKNYSETQKSSYNSNDHYDYKDTNNSFVDVDYNNSSYEYNDNSEDTEYSEPDSMLHSNFDKSHTNSKNLEIPNENESFEKQNEPIVSNHDYSHNLKRMINIVNNLEKNCNQIQPNFNNQEYYSSKIKNKKENISSASHFSSSSDKNQNQILFNENDNQLSLESLEKKHLSLVEAEKSFSTS